MALFDYALGQQIAAVYDAQSLGVEATITRMGDQVFTVDMFRTENTEAVMRLFGALGGELFAQERQLVASIEALLPELPTP